MTGFSHIFPVRVYYEDTDHGGVVYYANYLRFMERARTEFLRAEGIELDALDRDEGALFGVTQANISYLAPARFNDMLEVESILLEARGARLAVSQRILRGGELLAEAEIRLACMDRQGKARRIPASVLNMIKMRISKEKKHDR